MALYLCPWPVNIYTSLLLVTVCMPVNVCVHTTVRVCVYGNEARPANLPGKRLSVKAKVPLKREEREVKDSARLYIYR